MSKLKGQISKRGYRQGPSDETLKKKRDVNFAMSSSVMELWRRLVSLTIECTVLSKLHLISQIGEARVLFHDFLISFGMTDSVANYTLLNKWK